MLLRRTVLGLAIVVLMMTTGWRFAAASIDVVVHCCCGDHGLAEECGCPDCPATHAEDDGDRGHQDPAQPTLQRCFTDGDATVELLLPVFAHHAVADTVVHRTPAFVRTMTLPFAPSRTTDPLLEPPR